MRSGAKNALVTIRQRAETGADSEYNTPIVAETNWKADVFCNMTPRRGREVEVKGQVVAETYMKFDFEFFDVEGIDQKMIIVDETGVRYDIKAILRDVPLKNWISIDAIARKPEAGRT